jgi:hypothetical protein
MYPCWCVICTVQRWQLYSTLLAPVPSQRKQNLQKSYRNSHVLLLVLNLYSCKLHDCIRPMHLYFPREHKTYRKNHVLLLVQRVYSRNNHQCTWYSSHLSLQSEQKKHDEKHRETVLLSSLVSKDEFLKPSQLFSRHCDTCIFKEKANLAENMKKNSPVLKFL